MFIFGATDQDSKYVILSLLIVMLTSLMFAIAADKVWHLIIIAALTMVSMVFMSKSLLSRHSKVLFRTDFARSQFLPKDSRTTLVFGAFNFIIVLVIFVPSILLAFWSSVGEVSAKDLYLYLFGFFLGGSALFGLIHYMVIGAKSRASKHDE